MIDQGFLKGEFHCCAGSTEGRGEIEEYGGRNKQSSRRGMYGWSYDALRFDRVRVAPELRALILEYFGYSVKVFEFISDAHTPKNVMIVARRNLKVAAKSAPLLQKITAAKKYFGIARHHLEDKTGL